MPEVEYFTQFTEEVIAQQDQPCGRKSCKYGGVIKKGDPSIYVASVHSNYPGRFVCAGCFEVIKGSRSTFTRPVNRTSAHAQHAAGPVNHTGAQAQHAAGPVNHTGAQAQHAAGGTSIDASSVTAISRAVSGAQRKSTVHPAPVVPMLSPASMPLPPHSTSTQPVIYHPSMRSHIQPTPVAAGSSHGYGPQHAVYNEARQYWLNKAYNIPPAVPPQRPHPPSGPSLGPVPSPASLGSVPHTITLNITALHESDCGPRKRRVYGTPFGNICEGKRGVDANTTAPGAVRIALDLVVPRIKAFNPRFQWRPEEFVVRDEDWVDLSKHDDPYEGFFYKRCLVNAAGGRKANLKGVVFKSQSFTLHVVVPAQQWNEYEVFSDTDHDESPIAPTTTRGRHVISSSNLVDRSSLSKRPMRRTVRADSDRLFLSTPTSHYTCSDPPTIQLDPSSATLSPRASETTPVPVKRGHVKSTSVSSGTTQSPPPKRLTTSVVTPVPIQSCSPNRDRLRDALRSGGDANPNVSSVMKFKRELVEFYPIPIVSVEEILDNPEKRAFDICTAKVFPGQLRMDTTQNSLIGWGAFKSTQVAQLMLGTLRSTGIGSQICQDIAVKRFYIPNKSLPPMNSIKSPPADFKFPRYATADELEKLYREGNILYWAKSLFQLTYDFIDRAIGKSTTPTPFDIPRLRFVDAGLLLAIKSTAGVKAPSAGNVQTPYLAEELISSDDPFIKYIHNGDPTPIPEPYEPGYDTAQFLAFTQHVQFVKTGGLAYISDYQGCGTLLTDPQILTHPSVGGGKDLFGEGNLEIGVKLFAREHICNQFCRWSGFNLASPESILDDV